MTHCLPDVPCRITPTTWVLQALASDQLGNLNTPITNFAGVSALLPDCHCCWNKPTQQVAVCDTTHPVLRPTDDGFCVPGELLQLQVLLQMVLRPDHW